MQSVERWQLVLERSPLADGQFVYAVKSTGIYCRPTCPSRRPREQQVEFFETPEQAEHAGYRSCRRCRPETVAPRTQVVTELCRYIQAHPDSTLTLAELAGHVHLSPFHVQRIFKEQTGVSPRAYQASLRAKAARSLLPKTESVTDCIYEAGYSSSSRFYEAARDTLGMAPGTWRKGGRGASVAYTVTASPLGRILIAATPKGICFLALGDDDRELLAQLRGELPEASIERDDAKLARYSNVIFEYLSGATPQPQLPLDIRATAFQCRVWQLLRSIKPGKTRTYSDLAVELGDRKLTRAVARACATNPVSLLIPCHRVVRSTGQLAGYRWGLERKERLLEIERQSK
jgi:AraC family transcriptional regulator, regulatory protein of adaptative response / methylated-DNA-[protein]-cysteine methyltransferase